MTYDKFVNDIDKYVGCVMEFDFTINATGETYKTERYVWDNKQFADQASDLVTINNVRLLRKGVQS